MPAFIDHMRDYIGIPKRQQASTLIRITDTISMPPQKSYLVNAIMQNLEIRLNALIETKLRRRHQSESHILLIDDKGKEEATYEPYQSKHKQAIVIEGEPGIGKSTLYRAITQQYKQTLLARKVSISQLPASPDQQALLAVIQAELDKPIYEISVGSADAVATLTRALEEEAIIIGDESNMDPVLDAVLLQYLSGVDKDKNPINKPGFMFLGSKNSSIHAGRPEESPASRNRTHFLYMDVLGRHEYQLYAEDAGIEHPRQFVRAFYSICREFPAANARTFHVVLKAEKAALHLRQGTSGFFPLGIFVEKAEGGVAVNFMDDDEAWQVTDENEALLASRYH
jgi:AAA domain